MSKPALKFVLLGVCLLIGSCDRQEPPNSAFKVLHIEAEIENRTSQQELLIVADLSLKFTPEVEEALRKGVIILLRANARIVHDQFIPRVVEDRSRRWRIQYLPLSRHYRLTDTQTKEQTNWPRLRHALAALRRIEIELPPVALDAGSYRLEVRIYLDRRKLPPPLRLPALVSSAWKLESDWYQWPFHITK